MAIRIHRNDNRPLDRHEVPKARIIKNRELPSPPSAPIGIIRAKRLIILDNCYIKCRDRADSGRFKCKKRIPSTVARPIATGRRVKSSSRSINQDAWSVDSQEIWSLSRNMDVHPFHGWFALRYSLAFYFGFRWLEAIARTK